MKEFTYFQLIKKSKSNPKSSGVYLAEAHSRNVFSLTPIIFCMIFLSCFLRFNHSRYDHIFKKFVIIGSIFLIQIILFSLKNVITKFQEFIYIFYFIPIVLIIVSFLLIKYETFSLIRFKKVNNGL